MFSSALEEDDPDEERTVNSRRRERESTLQGRRSERGTSQPPMKGTDGLGWTLGSDPARQRNASLPNLLRVKRNRRSKRSDPTHPQIDRLIMQLSQTVVFRQYLIEEDA